MHIGLRIIREKASETYSTREEEQLRQCVLSAPGVTTVKEVARHSRGGYSLTVEASRESIDAIASHISAAGYRLVF
ncbi:MAG TPA: hypothetical protein VF773_07370 [Verrucomicrobiae bacterium]